ATRAPQGEREEPDRDENEEPRVRERVRAPQAEALLGRAVHGGIARRLEDRREEDHAASFPPASASSALRASASTSSSANFVGTASAYFTGSAPRRRRAVAVRTPEGRRSSGSTAATQAASVSAARGVCAWASTVSRRRRVTSN